MLLVCTPAELLGGFILRNLPPLYTSTWFHPARSRISQADIVQPSHHAKIDDLLDGLRARISAIIS